MKKMLTVVFGLLVLLVTTAGCYVPRSQSNVEWKKGPCGETYSNHSWSVGQTVTVVRDGGGYGYPAGGYGYPQSYYGGYGYGGGYYNGRLPDQGPVYAPGTPWGRR